MCLPLMPYHIAPLHQCGQWVFYTSQSRVMGFFALCFRFMPTHVHVSLPMSMKYHYNFVFFKMSSYTRQTYCFYTLSKPVIHVHFHICLIIAYWGLPWTPQPNPFHLSRTLMPRPCSLCVLSPLAAHLKHSTVLSLVPHITVGLRVRFILNILNAEHCKTSGLISK